jgi:SAM-dependent MidA family methyltransferase
VAHPAAADPSASPPSEQLLDRLVAVADPGGFVPFDRFMEVALYADGIGYYARLDTPLGPAGDFYTAPHVDPLFGHSLAQRLEAVRPTLDDGPLRVVELGPGDGTLAASVIPGLRRGPTDLEVEYFLVERGPGLRERALARARAAAEPFGVSVRAIPSLAALGPIRGAVIANELLDAQPARRLRWTGSAWVELGVRVDGHRLVPAEAPISSPVPGPVLPGSGENGTIVEVAPGAEAAVREVADHLAAGLCVLIDYGMSESELVAGHPRGTLEAIRGHRSVADPLAAPGTTDLSTFVNFDRIRAVARAAGLVELAFGSQAEALGRWGYPALLEEAVRSSPSAQEAVRRRLAAKNLLFGFARFQVLELAPPSSATELAVTPKATDRP